MLRCPQCDSTKINQYRMTTGPIWCKECGLLAQYKEVYNPFLPQEEPPYKAVNDNLEEKLDQPDKVAYARCGCGTEVLVVEYNEEWSEFNISIYELFHKTTWKQKLRYIWRIIKTGAPYGDQVVPDKEEMRGIQKLLNEVLEES